MGGRRTEDVLTAAGTARVQLIPGAGPGLLVLGHGAGGGIGAVDLIAAAGVAGEIGWSVAMVEQPYRVQGRRSPAPARQLDLAWVDVLTWLRSFVSWTGPLVVGGRSSGARVACRTAGVVQASGVLCLAFPLHPPGHPEKSRLQELDEVVVPTLVVQGERDPFGMPPEGDLRTVTVVPGDHSLKATDAVGDAVAPWLAAALGLA